MITDQYRQLNKELHAQGSYGRRGDKWQNTVQQLIDEIRPATVLDYGCGQGALARSLTCPVAEYDPAVEGKDKVPMPADLVICTDVLEHVEPEYLSDVLDHLQRLTLRHLFVVVSTRPARKTLSDGRNAHLIIQPWPFWEAELAQRFEIQDYKIHEKEVEVRLNALPSAMT